MYFYKTFTFKIIVEKDNVRNMFFKVQHFNFNYWDNRSFSHKYVCMCVCDASLLKLDSLIW